MTENNDEKVFFSDIVTSVDFMKFVLGDHKAICNVEGGTVLSIPLIYIKNVLFPEIYISIQVVKKEEIELLNEVYKSSKIIGVVSLKENKSRKYDVGTTAQILKIITLNDNKIQVILQGINVFKIEKCGDENKIGEIAEVKILEDKKYDKDSVKYRAVESVLKTLIFRFIGLQQNFPNEIKMFIEQCGDINLLIYLISAGINLSIKEKQKILEGTSVIKRGETLIEFLKKEIEFAEMKKRIATKAQDSINRKQRDFFIKQQIEALRNELDDNSSTDFDSDINELRCAGDKKKWNKKTHEFFKKLLKKADKSMQNSADYTILMNQAEFLLELPWENYSNDKIDIKKAKEELESRHFGIEKAKNRILEYLAALKLCSEKKSSNKKIRGQILCLVGPPGVGKTSLCKSIAKAMKREYVKVSLGGIDDEAEIRGHRKTYIGAMPGRILNGLSDVKTSNPVFVLDEIDKIANFHGDPSAALLEVLDQDQNKEFVDHYVETPYDLSKIIFIATANDVNCIPTALRDRLEIIEVTGYAIEEKLQIAKKYLIPNLMDEYCLKDGQVVFCDEIIELIIDKYTRESGVRELVRQLSAIIRKVGRKIVENEEYEKIICEKNIEEYLGIYKYERDLAQKMDKPGVAIGLAWTSVGGDILFIESSKMGGTGKLTLSGKLGEVMKESANLAFIYLKSHAEEYNINKEVFEKNDIHIHVPDGATPKDGPSAGITIFTTLYSLLSGRPIKNNLAMTGEITLRGKVTAVGGIKEKVLAARRAGITNIIMCKENKKDVSEIKKEYIENIKFDYVSTIEELAQLIF